MACWRRWVAGLAAGSLLVHNGKPMFAYALSNQPQHKYRVASDQPLTAGNHVIRVKFKYSGGGIGKAATAKLLVDEKPVGEAQIPQTMAFASLSMKPSTSDRTREPPVLEEYADKMPFRFTGTLEKFVVVLEPLKLNADEQRRLHDELAKAMMAVQ